MPANGLAHGVEAANWQRRQWPTAAGRSLKMTLRTVFVTVGKEPSPMGLALVLAFDRAATARQQKRGLQQNWPDSSEKGAVPPAGGAAQIAAGHQ